MSVFSCGPTISTVRIASLGFLSVIERNAPSVRTSSYNDMMSLYC